jgi:hypothetical protein
MKIFILFLIAAMFAACTNEPKAAVCNCYDISINTDSAHYYINIDWEGECGRMVTEKKATAKRDTTYFKKFDCFESDGIDNEIKKTEQ